MPHRSPARQRALLAVAGTGILAGYLLTSGAAAPLVTDLVALATASPSDAQAAAAAAAQANGRTVNGTRVTLTDTNTGWMADDTRPEWGQDRLVPQGPTGSDAPPSPQSPEGPQIQVPEDPKGRVFFTGPTAMRRYELKPPDDCPQASGMGVDVKNLTAISEAAGTATISWWDLNDPNGIGYTIDARAVATGEVTSKTIDMPGACTDVSVDFTGLTSGGTYQFIVSELADSPLQPGRQYRVGRGQTSKIVIA